MVRMMMWDRKTGDQNFKATMQDFVRTYAGGAVTTEDFKAVVEHDAGNGCVRRRNYFFDEYV
jgi:aminopeptidase N